jgi:hypothetical protein
MSVRRWQKVLAGLKVLRKVTPVPEAQLDAFEERTGLRLPKSYRSYCSVFGPGRLADWYDIAAPGFVAKPASLTTYCDLEAENQSLHDGLEWQEYSSAPEQYERGLIFAYDETGAVFFWDPAEVTSKAGHEYAIYVTFRNWSLQRLCDRFDGFIDICLQRSKVQIYTDPPILEFLPAAGRYKPLRPRRK